jgi:hypothetical protein
MQLRTKSRMDEANKLDIEISWQQQLYNPRFKQLEATKWHIVVPKSMQEVYYKITYYKIVVL